MHKDGKQILLHINPRPEQKQGELVVNAYHNTIWTNNETTIKYDNSNPLKVDVVVRE